MALQLVWAALRFTPCLTTNGELNQKNIIFMSTLYRTEKNPKQSQVLGQSLVFILFWSLCFTLAYAQAPLFTSNQNQYFLHGLARAGFGALQADWLAGTLDPTPVFSALVAFTYRVLPWLPIFYLYFGLLAGLYLFSLFGIVDEVFGVEENRAQRWLYFTLLVGLHAGALRFLMVRFLGDDWVYLFDGGVAGQRLLGAVLQPSTFGILLFFSIYLFLRGNIALSLIPLALTPTLHPTYFLSAALVTVSYMLIVYLDNRELRTPFLIGLGAFLGVLPIFVHTLKVFDPTMPVFIKRARELLVTFRVPHHAVPAEWWHSTVAIKIIFVLVALALIRKSRLFYLVAILFGAATVLTAAQVLTGSYTLALLFPWRLSTLFVPLSVSVIVAKLVIVLRRRFGSFFQKREQLILMVSIVSALLMALAGLGITIFNHQQKTTSSDREMMANVKANRAPGQQYLIPLHMQDFRLVTGAPAYVDFKSIPYRDVELVEWYRRLSLAGKLYRAPYQRRGCSVLEDLYHEGVTHVVLPYDHVVQNCPILERQYHDLNYAVFSLEP